MSVAVHVFEASWSEHKDTLRSIREVVFIEEQAVPRELEWDDADEDSIHFLAINELPKLRGLSQ